MNWSGFFQVTVTKSLAALICGGVVLWLALMGAADVECRVAKPPPPTFFPGQPTPDLSPPGPPTTSEGCQTYGSFFGMPADTAPFILGLLAGLVGWGGEMAYKKHQENKEVPPVRRHTPPR